MGRDSAFLNIQISTAVETLLECKTVSFKSCELHSINAINIRTLYSLNGKQNAFENNQRYKIRQFIRKQIEFGLKRIRAIRFLFAASQARCLRTKPLIHASKSCVVIQMVSIKQNGFWFRLHAF